MQLIRVIPESSHMKTGEEDEEKEHAFLRSGDHDSCLNQEIFDEE